MTDLSRHDSPSNPLADLDAEIDFTEVVTFIKHWQHWLLAATIGGALAGAAVWFVERNGERTTTTSSRWVVNLEAPEGTEAAVFNLPTAITNELNNSKVAGAFYDAVTLVGPQNTPSPARTEEWLTRQMQGNGLFRNVSVFGRQIHVTVDSTESWTQEHAQASVEAGVNVIIADFNDRFVKPYDLLTKEKLQIELLIDNQKTQALTLFAHDSNLPPLINKDFIAHLAPLIIDEASSVNTALFLLGSLPDTEPKKAPLIREFASNQRELQDVKGRLQVLKKMGGIETYLALPSLSPKMALRGTDQAEASTLSRLRLLLVIGAVGGCLLGIAIILGIQVNATFGRLRSITAKPITRA